MLEFDFVSESCLNFLKKYYNCVTIPLKGEERANTIYTSFQIIYIFPCVLLNPNKTENYCDDENLKIFDIQIKRKEADKIPCVQFTIESWWRMRAT